MFTMVNLSMFPAYLKISPALLISFYQYLCCEKAAWNEMNTALGQFAHKRAKLGHGGSSQFESLRVSGEGTFISLKLECQSTVLTCDLRLSKPSALTTAPGPPAEKGAWKRFLVLLTIKAVPIVPVNIIQQRKCLFLYKNTNIT